MTAELLCLEKDTCPFGCQVIFPGLDTGVLDVLGELREHKGALGGGGVKVFTFWIDRYVAFSSVMSGNTERPLSSCQISWKGLVSHFLTHNSCLRAKSSAVRTPCFCKSAAVLSPMPQTLPTGRSC